MHYRDCIIITRGHKHTHTQTATHTHTHAHFYKCYYMQQFLLILSATLTISTVNSMSQYATIVWLLPEPWPPLSLASLTIAMSKQFWVRDITMKACSSASMSATLSLEVPFNLRDRVKRCEEWFRQETFQDGLTMLNHTNP